MPHSGAVVIELGARARVFAHGAPCDMRKGIDSLAGLVTMSGHDVAEGDVFVFIAKDRKRAKCLWFDRVCARLLVNRIDSGRFSPLWRDDGKEVEMTLSELRLLLNGSKLVDRKAQARVSRSSFR